MSLRQRIPFRFSDAGDEDDHVLDEQEQEELVRHLRDQEDTINSQYLLSLLLVIGLSCLLHVIFILKQSKQSPISALLPNRTPSPPIPLPTFFALLHILLQLHLCLHLLPPAHPILRALSSLRPPLGPLVLPLPLLHPATLAASAVAPALALLLRHGWPDVAWWAVTGLMTLLVYYVKKWIRQSDESIRELDGMRYDARGA
ncbi:hypothetical protein B0H21DRAFT_821752 [Amylocystis lapponica]|nr:hypothetical protein B0H21DRAFT_821752 [Amylocystis lapponica]